MPYCPACRLEYWKFIDRCEKCAMPLRPKYFKEPLEEFVPARTVPSREVAEILATHLRKHHITAYPLQVQLKPEDPWGDIMVRPKDLDQSSRLLQLYLLNLPNMGTGNKMLQTFTDVEQYQKKTAVDPVEWTERAHQEMEYQQQEGVEQDPDHLQPEPADWIRPSGKPPDEGAPPADPLSHLL